MSSASTKPVSLSWTTQPSCSPRPIHRASGSAQWFVGGLAFEAIFEVVDHLPEQPRYSTKKKSRLWTEKSAKSYDWASEKCARSRECFARKIQSGMLRNIREQQDASYV
jgi:hypothetical protein